MEGTTFLQPKVLIGIGKLRICKCTEALHFKLDDTKLFPEKRLIFHEKLSRCSENFKRVKK